MKGFKVKVNMDLVNTVLLVVILALVVYCLIKQKERFDAHQSNKVNTEVLSVFKKYQNAAAAAAANAPMNAPANAAAANAAAANTVAANAPMNANAANAQMPTPTM